MTPDEFLQEFNQYVGLEHEFVIFEPSFEIKKFTDEDVLPSGYALVFGDTNDEGKKTHLRVREDGDDVYTIEQLKRMAITAMIKHMYFETFTHYYENT